MIHGSYLRPERGAEDLAGGAAPGGPPLSTRAPKGRKKTRNGGFLPPRYVAGRVKTKISDKVFFFKR
jgi:hypothetical protein